MNRPVRKRRVAAEVVHYFFAVANDHNRVRQFRAVEGELENETVRLFVIGNENWSKRRTHVLAIVPCFPPSGRGSSTQKLLPAPGSDSTPTLPPMRSTTFRTIARPIPVPSYRSSS